MNTLKYEDGLHTSNPDMEGMFENIDRINKKIQENKYKRSNIHWDIIDTTNRPHVVEIVGFDAVLNINAHPVDCLFTNPTIDPPVMSGSIIKPDYKFGKSYSVLGNYKSCATSLKILGIKIPPELPSFCPPFNLGDETLKGPFDQIPHRELFEKLVDIYWTKNTCDIKEYVQLIRERLVHMFLLVYYARWSCKERNGQNFIGPIGISSVPGVDSMKIINSKEASAFLKQIRH